MNYAGYGTKETTTTTKLSIVASMKNGQVRYKHNVPTPSPKQSLRRSSSVVSDDQSNGTNSVQSSPEPEDCLDNSMRRQDSYNPDFPGKQIPSSASRDSICGECGSPLARGVASFGCPVPTPKKHHECYEHDVATPSPIRK